jgi:hypothetical protein
MELDKYIEKLTEERKKRQMLLAEVLIKMDLDVTLFLI